MAIFEPFSNVFPSEFDTMPSSVTWLKGRTRVSVLCGRAVRTGEEMGFAGILGCVGMETYYSVTSVNTMSRHTKRIISKGVTRATTANG